ncbi:MAG: hypothetical protein WC001_00735 [Desulfurivibrionaceae bacterium]
MDQLLKGFVKETTSEALSLDKMIHCFEGAASAKNQAEKPSRPPSSKKTTDDSKKKSTHYLSGEIFADLDEARDKINALVNQRTKSKVSKSRIVDQALRMILKEFEEKGDKSRLIKEIIKGLKQK